MEALFGYEQVLEYVGAIIGVALALGAVAYVLPYAIKRGIDVIAYVRQYRPQILAAVDEPTDPINVFVDKLLDYLKPGNYGKVSAVVLYGAAKAFLDHLEKQLEIPQEPETLPSDQ